MYNSGYYNRAPTKLRNVLKKKKVIEEKLLHKFALIK